MTLWILVFSLQKYFSMSLNFITYLDALEHRQTLNDKKCICGPLISLSHSTFTSIRTHSHLEKLVCCVTAYENKHKNFISCILFPNLFASFCKDCIYLKYYPIYMMVSISLSSSISPTPFLLVWFISMHSLPYSPSCFYFAWPLSTSL